MVCNLSYKIAGLPGQSWAQFNWTNKPKIDLETPFGQLPPGANSEAVGVLLGVPSSQALPINYRSTRWVTIGNFSQYIFVKDHSGAIAEKLGSGQPLRGNGVFGALDMLPRKPTRLHAMRAWRCLPMASQTAGPMTVLDWESITTESVGL